MAGNREFFYRRLHSLLGVIPVGIFLTEHLLVNHFATGGEASFNKAAGTMSSLPFKLFLETFIIFLPLLYHAIYGLYIAFTSNNNVGKYGYFRNWMFLIQRVTGVITFIFVAWHVWQTRIQVALGAEPDFQMMADILSSPFMFWFYLIGIVSAVFHFTNGLSTFLISWGVTLSPRSQVITTYVTMILFIALSIVGIQALVAFV